MDVEEGMSNGNAEESSTDLRCMKREAVDNEGRFGIVNIDLAGCGSGNSANLQTYKRRKHTKSGSESKSEDEGTVFSEDDGQMSQQSIKESKTGVNPNACEQIDLPTKYTAGCSKVLWKFASEDVFLSSSSLSDDEGGVQKGIREEYEFRPETGSELKAKEHDHPDENRRACNSEAEILLQRYPKENSQNHDANGNVESLSQRPVAEKCRHAWRNVLISEKFSSLCKILSDSFPGIKIDSFLDLNLMNSKMKDGVYDHSPTLFLSDFQQVWDKVKKIGSDMASLAENLSNISNSCYEKEFPSWESESRTKTEQGEDYNSYRVCPCKRCGDKADDRDCLVCDSCEEMYHVSCIVPAVKEIPLKSWYCASCSPPENQSPHDNCTVCHRLNKAPNKPCTHNNLGESSNFVAEEGFRELKSGKILGLCKNCESEIDECEKSKMCSHRYCPSKHYHMRCLAKNELKSYGPGWYCPSCLCRSCLTDKDDDQIILCDGCDHAYHIYCTKPELDSIPTGKWFCGSCDAKLVEIQRAKKAYSRYEKGEGGFGFMEKQWSRKGCMEQDKGGRMEMLLTAVTTLTCEEKLTGM